MKQSTALKQRIVPLLIILVLFFAIFTSGMFAKYLKRTDDVNNTFNPALPITPEVVEDFNNVLKENVKINVGDTKYPVYVRAKIVINWKNADGTVYFKPPLTDPEGLDYEIDLNLLNSETEENCWVYEDGFYYYVDPDGKLVMVDTEQSTDILIKSCKQLNFDDVPEGYSLSVEIIAQTVQAYGTTDDPATEKPAYKDAWGEKTP